MEKLSEGKSRKQVKKEPISFYFFDNERDANECTELVVKGIKQATTRTSLWWYEKNNESLLKEEDQNITDWKGNARAIIETTRAEPTPYSEITNKLARILG